MDIVDKLTQGNLDRVLDRNIMTLFPGIDMTFLVVAVSRMRRSNNSKSDWSLTRGNFLRDKHDTSS